MSKESHRLQDAVNCWQACHVTGGFYNDNLPPTISDQDRGRWQVCHCFMGNDSHCLVLLERAALHGQRSDVSRCGLSLLAFGFVGQANKQEIPPLPDVFVHEHGSIDSTNRDVRNQISSFEHDILLLEPNTLKKRRSAVVFDGSPHNQKSCASVIVAGWPCSTAAHKSIAQIASNAASIAGGSSRRRDQWT